jgi:hypothetical protein
MVTAKSISCQTGSFRHRRSVMRRAVCALYIGMSFVSGCDRGGPADRTVPPPDPWLRQPPVEFVTTADELHPDAFAVVTAKEAEALARLRNSACVMLDPEEASELAGRPLGGAGGCLVLLRGLRWDTPHGSFTISWRPGSVRVNHGCLGSHAIPIVRRAIVARLPDEPTEVYVDLCMAE